MKVSLDGTGRVMTVSLGWHTPCHEGQCAWHGWHAQNEVMGVVFRRALRPQHKSPSLW